VILLLPLESWTKSEPGEQEVEKRVNVVFSSNDRSTLGSAACSIPLSTKIQRYVTARRWSYFIVLVTKDAQIHLVDQSMATADTTTKPPMLLVI
jgi:hypothetical protein